MRELEPKPAYQSRCAVSRRMLVSTAASVELCRARWLGFSAGPPVVIVTSITACAEHSPVAPPQIEMARHGAIPLLVRMMSSPQAAPGAKEAAAGAVSNLACIKANQARGQDDREGAVGEFGRRGVEAVGGCGCGLGA